MVTATDEIIELLTKSGPQTVGDIAGKLGFSVGTTVTLVNVLQNQAQVECNIPSGYSPRPDDTMVKLTITRDGANCPLDPFPGRCVVQREGFKAKTTIVLTDQSKRIPTIGTVLAVGDSKRNYLVGKRVLFGRYSGVPIYIAGHPEYVIFDYSELLAEVTTTDKIEFEMETNVPLTAD